MNETKTYTAPELEITSFDAEDVIVTSGLSDNETPFAPIH